ncbi:TfoX/Sxy family protein [Cribrihabitans neustonicus]|uniref:TfoX/Sxy family protein n=1 Tax=Cribrihabitans neustonicus TaxID=1429085 RepID=UPI003B5C8F58
MNTPVSSIRNLGPAYEEACARAGIASAEELRALGADAAYARLLQSGTRPHFIGYYVLVMALQGRPWNDCKGAEKQELRKRFDDIKACAFDRGRAELEAALDMIGVISRPGARPPGSEKRTSRAPDK